MSWEGYIQCWCRNGHYFSPDPYEFEINEVCPECGMKSIFTNVVDQTNCDGVSLEVKKLYGRIYEIPTEEDRKIANKIHLKTCPECSGNYNLETDV